MPFPRTSRFLYGMIDRFWESIAMAFQIILPRTCCVCGQRLLTGERHLCLVCRTEMPLTYFWNMPHNRMSDRFNELIQDWLDVGEDRQIREPYAYAAALFYFSSEGGYREIPYRIKYQGDVGIGAYFGRMLGKRLAGSERWADADVVIPVPLHWTRQWKRGYNQAEAIASGLAEALGTKMRTDILMRSRITKTQTILDMDEKAVNVADAFKIRDGAQVVFKGNGHIILVDDLFTSGSTLFECFRALRSAFPPTVRISVATLGFVGAA